MIPTPCYSSRQVFLILGIVFFWANVVALYFPAHAQAVPATGNILFILDGSGSMWGKLEDKHKIEIAKEVMTNLVQELPNNIKAGLEVYGHRRKGDCDDIELLVPLHAGDRQALIQSIEAINPKGKTPITKAFQRAAEQLRTVEEETTVVLVSDGKETCEGDPCTLVRDLRAQGIKVKVHVVGFDVNQDEREQLVCIAEAGGGKYFSADSTDELKEALTEVVVDLRPVGCAQYAETSVRQEQQNIEKECSLAGEHWHMDYDRHYNWCLAQPMDSAAPDEEVAGREDALTRCATRAERVCQGDFGPCGKDRDCCEGSICAYGTCVSDDGCARQGQSCSITAGGCCLGGACRRVGSPSGPTQCCGRDGDPCGPGKPCCGTQSCVDGRCQCQRPGDFCMIGDCCGASFCDSDTNRCN